MTWSLLDVQGHRKYLTAAERLAFIEAAIAFHHPKASTYCLTVALTGVRVSEALSLTIDRIDIGTCSLVVETLKRRRRGVYRAIPVPRELITLLGESYNSINCGNSGLRESRIWPVSRTTAWKWVKMAMREAGIADEIAKPRALRHAFAVEAVRQRVALSLVKRWLGHARIETTAIYADPIGEEERALASLTWRGISLQGHSQGSRRVRRSACDRRSVQV
jgi:integrase/recombinase XerD